MELIRLCLGLENISMEILQPCLQVFLFFFWLGKHINQPSLNPSADKISDLQTIQDSMTQITQLLSTALYKRAC